MPQMLIVSENFKPKFYLILYCIEQNCINKNPTWILLRSHQEVNNMLIFGKTNSRRKQSSVHPHVNKC